MPDEQVGVVDRGRGYLDDHLPCLWRGNFDLVQLHHLLRAEAVDLDGLHPRHFALLVSLATLLERIPVILKHNRCTNLAGTSLV